MKISDSYKRAIYRAFLGIVFKNREHGTILEILETKVQGSDNLTIIPPIQGFKVEKVDDIHDRVIFEYDDYSFDGIITWEPCKIGKGVILTNFE